MALFVASSSVVCLVFARLQLGTFFVFSRFEGIGSISKMSKSMEGHRYYSCLSLFPMDFFNLC